MEIAKVIQTWASLGPALTLSLLHHPVSFQPKKGINGSSMHGRETLKGIVT